MQLHSLAPTKLQVGSPIKGILNEGFKSYTASSARTLRIIVVAVLPMIVITDCSVTILFMRQSSNATV